MAKQDRGKGGKFAPKSDEPRSVRTVRLTNTTWAKLGQIAESRSITRADLIEQIVEQRILEQASVEESTMQQVATAVERVLNDPSVTRNGKDRGSVRRALQALLNLLN
jgi:hypothetical protein